MWGKSGVSVSGADSNRVYALVEAKPGNGLYRSDDAGPAGGSLLDVTSEDERITTARRFAEIDVSYSLAQRGRFRASIFRQRGAVGIVMRLIPIVILTSSREEQDILASYSLGANSYIRKTFDPEEFRAEMKLFATYWLDLCQLPA